MEIEQSNNTKEFGNYNTAINVIGGLKDWSVVFNAINAHFSQHDSLEEFVNQRNELNLPTEGSRTRIGREVRNGFLCFLNEDHEVLIKSIFSERVPLQDKELVLLWQFALNNRLFREITLRVFVKTYYSGRTRISKEDVIAYLKEFLQVKESIQLRWTESTIHMLATKYLNLMSKLGFLCSGRVKTFNHIRPSSEAQVLFLYFMKIYSPGKSNILTNELLPMSFISSEDTHDRLKKLSMKGFFNMNFNGVDLNIELTHSYRGVCDVLYN
jgi:hypothetical protein